MMRLPAATGRGRRVAAITVLALIVASLTLPLWSTRMESPQYRGDEQLHVYVYAHRVTGDLRELATLNQYVGVKLRLDGPELGIARWVFALLGTIALLAALVPPAHGRLASRILATGLAMTLLSGAAVLQYRLYEMGHDRGHTALAGVEDFTAPILGSRKIANFTVHTRPEIGGWALLAALAVSGWASLAPPSPEAPDPSG